MADTTSSAPAPIQNPAASLVTPIDLADFIKKIGEAVNATNAAKTNLNDVNQTQTERVAKSTDQLYKDSQDTLTALQSIDATGKEARRLATSNDFMDRVKLLGAQMFDPNFTLAGRTKNIAALGQDLALRENIHSVTAQDAANQVDVAKAKVDAATSSQEMLSAGLKAKIDATKLAQDKIVNDQNLKDANLIPKSKTELSNFLTSAKPDANGFIQLDGMNYRPDEIRNRVKDLTMRENLSLMKPELTNPTYAAAMNTWKGMNLQTMNMGELNSIQQHGGMAADGTQYPMDLVNTAVANRKQAVADNIAHQQAEYMARNFPSEYIKDQGTFLKQMQTTLPGDSPLQQDLAKFGHAISYGSEALDKAQSPEEKLAIINSMAQARTAFNDAAKKEALRLGGRDKVLGDLIYQKLTTGSMQPGLLQEKITEQLAANKPIGQLIPDAQAPILKDMFQKAYTHLLSQQGLAASISGGKVPDTELRKQAASVAYGQFQNRMAREAMDRGLLMVPNITSPQPSPLHGVVSPGEWQDILNSAGENSWKDIQRQFKLSDAQLNKVKQGIPIDGHTLADLSSAQRLALDNNVFQQLEGIKPGLGNDTASWFAENYTNLANHQLSLSPQQLQPVIDEKIQDQAQAFAEGMMSARNRLTMTSAQKVGEYLTGAHDPRFMNALLLQSDDGLNQEQRQMIYDQVIHPILQDAQKKGLSPQDQIKAIDVGLSNYKTQDKALSAALKHHLSQRFTLESHIGLWLRQIVKRHMGEIQNNWLQTGVQNLLHPFDSMQTTMSNSKPVMDELSWAKP